MDANDRVERLMEEAKRLGMDHPSESMLVDLIWETEYNTMVTVEETAKRHGHEWKDGRLFNKEVEDVIRKHAHTSKRD